MGARIEPMSSVDVAWLRMEKSQWHMSIVGLMLFDRPIDYDAFFARVETRLGAAKRFKQRVIEHGGKAFWEQDPDFDFSHHITHLKLKHSSAKAFDNAVQEVLSEPLAMDLPLWHFTLVTRPQTTSAKRSTKTSRTSKSARAKTALVVRVHHCMSDILATIQVCLNMRDPTQDDVSETDAESNRSLWERLYAPAKQWLGEARQVGQEIVDSSRDWVRNPRSSSLEYLKKGLALAEDIRKVALVRNDPPTLLKPKEGVSSAVGARHFSWSQSIPTESIKTISKRAQVTSSDVMIAALAGALRRYLLGRDESIDGLSINAAVPVNLRSAPHASDLGNEFGLVLIELPIGIEDPGERLKHTRNRMLELKRSYQARLFRGAMAVVGKGPTTLEETTLEILSKKASVLLLNIPNFDVDCYLCESKLQQCMWWMPTSAQIAVVISMIHLAHGLQVGFMVDDRIDDSAKPLSLLMEEELSSMAKCEVTSTNTVSA